MPAARLWAWPVRLCHWALAATVAFNFIEDSGDYTHRMVGYGAAAVVLVRLTWGALSRSNGRLGALRPSVRETWLYLGQLRRGVFAHASGDGIGHGVGNEPAHNPLAIWMIWLLWSLVLLLGVTGWMSRLDAFWGDDDVHLVHSLLADGLLACICLHLAAVVVMSVLLKENLPLAMLFRRDRGGGTPHG